MKEIRGRLSERAGRGWDRFLASEGVNATALLEAMGRDMADGKWWIPSRVSREAKEIALERDSRSRGRPSGT